MSAIPKPQHESLASLSNEILKDVALTQKLLRLVNTAAYRHTGGGGISTVSRAVALLKGNVDEVWYRDAQQRISFERVFHDDARVVDYSTGELATLHVNVDWAALSRLVHPAELAQLKRVSKQGRGLDTQWHLRGWVGKQRLDVDWLPALDLPKRVTRRVPGVSTVRL